MVTQYDWRKFFPLVAKKLYEISENADTRDSEMVKWAKEVFGKEKVSDKEHPIVEPEFLKKSGIDPFSFVYSLSIRPAAKSYGVARKRRKKCAKVLLWDEQLSNITDDGYPYAMPMNSLFHSGGSRDNGTPPKERDALDRLWILFRDTYNAKKYSEITDERIRQTIQDICGAGLVNLTQTLFLINPRVFLPIDDRTLHLSANKNICSKNQKEITKQVKSGELQFSDVMESLLKPFPGCFPYEINQIGYLIEEGKIKIRQKYWLISSNARGPDDGGGKDWWEGKHTQDAEQQWSFREQNCVWTSRPDDGGGKLYPVQEPARGDIMLCRIGQTTAHGIGIVTHNGYSNGWKEDAYISVNWIAAAEEYNIENMGPQQGLTTGGSYINRYKTAYPETFELLERLLTKIKK